jgi:murein DD-endopeptidase MepM/ murein hydrolase activator NlpD
MRSLDWRRPHPFLNRLRRNVVLCFCVGLLSCLGVGLLTHSAIAQQITAYSRPQNWQGASFPVEQFLAYTSPFGYRPSATGGAGSEFHSGLDIAAPRGSYIRNWWGGRVVQVSDDSRCGTSVVVQSGDWTHIYCHMEGQVDMTSRGKAMVDRAGGIAILEGQPIPTGARIGRVGMTGRTTGPHLHWSLKHNGDWVDPGLVLRAMFAEQKASSTAVR